MVMRKCGVLLLAILCTCASAAMAAQCIEGDCINGRGSIIHEDGRKYTGEFKNGIIDGTGIFHHADGSVYEG